MNQILTLPLALSPEGSRRLCTQLEYDFRAEVDLGPCMAQIECLTASLTHSLRELRETLGRAVAALPEEDPAICGLRDAVSGMTRLAQLVMASAVGFHMHPFGRRYVRLGRVQDCRPVRGHIPVPAWARRVPRPDRAPWTRRGRLGPPFVMAVVGPGPERVPYRSDRTQGLSKFLLHPRPAQAAE